jgi:hypothetical protein
MPFYLLKESVTSNGAHIEAGEVMELTEKSGNALVEEGKAEAVEPEGEPVNPPSDDEGGEDNGQEPDDEAKVAKALDDQYKRDELAKAAKEAGVEFAYDAKKGDILNAVMEQGKADLLLK